MNTRKPLTFRKPDEILAMRFDDSALLRRQFGYVELLIYKNNNTYPIEHERMDTPEKVLGWVFHLTKKLNVTKEHIRAFIQVAKEIGVKVDMHS